MRRKTPMRRKQLAMAAMMAAASIVTAGAAQACAYSPGAGWTPQGGGTPAAMVVLGKESCQGSVLGVNLQIIFPPQHGKVRVVNGNSYIYTPNRAYRGPDVFKVTTTIANVGLAIGAIMVMVQ